MITSNLRRVGGSTMFTVPAELLKLLDLGVGDALTLTVEDGRLVAAPQRKHYTVEELLAESDYSEPLSRDEREWVDAAPVGRELI